MNMSKISNGIAAKRRNKMDMQDKILKENQERQLNRIRHEIEVAKLQLELENLKKYGLPLNIPNIK